MNDKVERFLASLNLEKYLDLFEAQEIDESVLADLSDRDLESIGLPLGPRKKILRALSSPVSGEDSNSPAAGVAASTPASHVETSDANRRHLTVMFCDLVGSTQLSQNLDPEDLREINRSFQDVCSRSIRKFGGYVARYMGDGILAYFGYPQASENDEERAVLSGLDLIEGVKGIPVSSPDVKPGLEVRVGIATGPVVVGDIIGEGASQESAVVGETPNLAARLQSIASPGAIIVSPETREAVKSMVKCKPMGQRMLKGFRDSVEPWLVTGTAAGGGHFEQSVARGLGRFVGRGAELERLLNDWTRVGNGEQLISIVSGEAGIGKSRLVHEFLESVPDGVTVLEGHCVSHGVTTPFLPFVDMLRRKFRGDGGSGNVESALGKLEISDAGNLPFLINLLGVSTPALADMDTGLLALRTREAIVAFVRHFTESGPTILFVNDCHWIDTSSDLVLGVLADAVRPMSLFTLATARPEYGPEWQSNPPVSRIVLQPFSAEETRSLLSDRMETARLNEKVCDDLYDRSGGNPFFVEELARHLRETGGEDKGGAGGSVMVPRTLEGLLLSRVDRLSRDARMLLQAASVIGRRFSMGLAAEIANIDRHVDVVRELLGNELIIQDASRFVDAYRFNHALVQDAVYGSLLSVDRKALHQAIAVRLENRHAGNDFEYVEEIARHYRAADAADEAIRWTTRAGEKALGLFAIDDALTWFGSSLALMRSQQVIAKGILGPVLVNQMESLCWDIDYPAMLELAENHLPQVENEGDLKHVSRTYSWLADAHINTGRFAEALADLNSAEKIADTLGDLECKGYARAILVWLHAITFECGVEEYVEDNMEQVLAIAEKLDDLFLKALTYYSAALDAALRGMFGAAREFATVAIELGEKESYPPASTYGYSVRSFANMLDGSHDIAELDAREAVRNAACKYDSLMSRMTLGSALVLGGKAREGMEVLERTNRERESLSMIGFMYWPDIVYALGLTKTDQSRAGEESLKTAFRKFSELGNPRAAALAALVLGRYQQGNCDAAAPESLREAARLGRETAMPWVVAQAEDMLASTGETGDARSSGSVN